MAYKITAKREKQGRGGGRAEFWYLAYFLNWGLLQEKVLEWCSDFRYADDTECWATCYFTCARYIRCLCSIRSQIQQSAGWDRKVCVLKTRSQQAKCLGRVCSASCLFQEFWGTNTGVHLQTLLPLRHSSSGSRNIAAAGDFHMAPCMQDRLLTLFGMSTADSTPNRHFGILRFSIISTWANVTSGCFLFILMTRNLD